MVWRKAERANPPQLLSTSVLDGIALSVLDRAPLRLRAAPLWAHAMLETTMRTVRETPSLYMERCFIVWPPLARLCLSILGASRSRLPSSLPRRGRDQRPADDEPDAVYGLAAHIRGWADLPLSD